MADEIRRLPNLQRFKTGNRYLRVAMAESVGTLILVLCGCGSVAQMELSGFAKAQFLSVNIAFGFAVTAGSYVSAGVSGAHLNPAVSLAMFILRKITWRLLLVYCLAQFIGALFGAGFVYLVYFDALYVYGGGNWTVYGPQATAGIFASYPSEHLGAINGIVDQIIATATLMICILAIIDRDNNSVPRGLQPIVVGIVVLLVGLSMGFNCGYPINPARDLAPRIFTAVAGWGSEVFRAGDYWWWIPVVCPMFGGAVGVFIYVMLIALHLPEGGEERRPPEYEMVVAASAT
ncbi:aquaporin-3-like [Eleutherodactylus coqui]